MSSIYISVPSVLDTEYYRTVDDIFSNADNPKSIFVGTAHSIPFKNPKIIDEIKKNLSMYPNVRSKFLNSYRSSGVGFGRLESMSMYDGEDYVMQIDSHTMMVKSWDTKIIEYYNEAKSFSKSNKTIMSCYLPCYKYYDSKTRDYCEGDLPPYSCYATDEIAKDFDNGDEQASINWKNVYPQIPRWVTPTNDDFYEFIKNKYVYARKLNANFMFADYKLAENYKEIIPFPFFFFEEEFIMSVEAYDLGYHFIHPNFKLPLAHLYGNHFNEYYSRPGGVLDQSRGRIDSAKILISEYFNTDNNKKKIEKYAKYAGLSYPELQSISIEYIPER